MTGRADSRADRGVSEATGVAILVVFTVLVTASVGVGVLFVGGEEETAGVTANFSFDHQSEHSVMLVTHAEGDALPAGDIVLEGESASVTWAELAGSEPNSSVGPGSAVQLSANSAWGSPVTTGQTIEIYWAPDAENRTQLDVWPATP